jgi:opacity protein-like surface antigen
MHLVQTGLGLGMEYAYSEKIMLRAGYRYETDVADKELTQHFLLDLVQDCKL